MRKARTASTRLTALPILCISALCATGCGNDTTSQSTDPGLRTAVLSGRVVLPRPLIDARVTVLRLGEESETALATTQTDGSGHFTVEIEDVRDGDPLVVRADSTDAQFLDLATTTHFHLADGDLLEAGVLLSPQLQEHPIIVDPYATLAMALARTYHRQGSSLGISNTDWAQVIPLATERIASHLGNAPVPDLRFVEPPIPAPGTLLPWPGSGAGLALALGGFSQLSWRLNFGAGDVSPMVLLMALRRDLEDGLLDGRAPGTDGDGVTLSINDTPLGPETTRYDLAEAIHDYITITAVEALDVDDLPAVLAARHGLYERISTDASPLYGDHPPTLFDPIPPTFTTVAGAPAHGSLLCGSEPVTISVEVADNQPLASIAISDEDKLRPGIDCTVTLQEFAGTGRVDLTVSPAAFGGASFGLSITAIDSAGNQSIHTLTHSVDGVPPAIVSVTPDPAVCTQQGPATLAVETAHDGGGSLTVTSGDSEEPCAPEPGDGATFTCGVSPAHGAPVTIRAVDDCGDEAVYEATFCIDSTPPTVTFDRPDGSWYCAADPHVQVTAADDVGPLETTITVNGQPAATLPAEDGGLVVTLPTTPGTDAAMVDVIATDASGNETSHSALYLFDPEGPEIAYADGHSPIVPAISGAAFTILVSDPHSGVASVSLSDDQWTLTELEDGAWLVQAVDPAPAPGDMFFAMLAATDNMGQETSFVAKVQVDGQDPALTLLPFKFRDEAGCVAALEESGKVAYDCSAAPSLSLDETGCDGGCPPFAKFATRLDYTDPADASLNNLPVVYAQPWDDCANGVAGGTFVTLSYAFYNGDTLLHGDSFDPLPCEAEFQKLIPIAVQTFSDSTPAEFSFAPENLPDRLVVTATDMAGRTATVELAFAMTVRPPPVFLLPVDAEEDPDDHVAALSDPFAPQLHILAQDGGTWLRRRLVNPTDLPVQATLLAMPAEDVTFWHGRAYFDSPTGPGSCPTNKCRYKEGAKPVSACATPKSFQSQPLFEQAGQPTRLRVVDPETQQKSPLAVGDSLLLEPGMERYLDVRTLYSEAGLTLSPPQEVTLSSGEVVWLTPTSADSWQASCGWGGFPATTSHYELWDVVTFYLAQFQADARLKLTVRNPAAAHVEPLEEDLGGKSTSYTAPAMEYAPF